MADKKLALLKESWENLAPLREQLQHVIKESNDVIYALRFRGSGSGTETRYLDEDEIELWLNPTSRDFDYSEQAQALLDKNREYLLSVWKSLYEELGSALDHVMINNGGLYKKGIFCKGNISSSSINKVYFLEKE